MFLQHVHLACLALTVQEHVLVETVPHATMSMELVLAWMGLLVKIARKVSLTGLYYTRRANKVCVALNS